MDISRNSKSKELIFIFLFLEDGVVDLHFTVAKSVNFKSQFFELTFSIDFAVPTISSYRIYIVALMSKELQSSIHKFEKNGGKYLSFRMKNFRLINDLRYLAHVKVFFWGF